MKLVMPKDLDMSGKTVLLRTGLDRFFGIPAALPTINYLAAQKAKVIIFSESVSENAARGLADSMARKLLAVSPAEKRLPEYAVPHVFFLRRVLAAGDLHKLVSQLRGGDIAILEQADPAALPELGDFYLNDDFSACRFPDALAAALPSAAGFALAAEAAALSRILEGAKHPFVVMMGGAKLENKVSALSVLAGAADSILLGGPLGNLFLKIQGYAVGKSWLKAEDKAILARSRQILRDYKGQIRLPSDVVVSSSADGNPEVVKIDKVKSHQMILDIGPQTILEYSRVLKAAGTLLWSGPLGYLENPSFSHGTLALARVFAARTRGRAFGVAGGSHTAEAIKRLGLSQYVDHISPSGAAMLHFLARLPMPGLEALAA